GAPCLLALYTGECQHSRKPRAGSTSTSVPHASANPSHPTRPEVGSPARTDINRRTPSARPDIHRGQRGPAMTAVAPPDIVTAAVEGGEKKAHAPGWQLALRGFLAVYLLGAATLLAVVVTEATGVAILGAVLFPLGLTLVVLLGWELVTGAYGLVPLAAMEGRIRVRDCLRVFGWMILGHAVGGLAAAWMLT